MSYGNNEAIKKISKGTAITLVSGILMMLFGFVSRVMLARYGGESEYGVFCLALTVLNICVGVATLGLREGATRYIAYFRGRNEQEKVEGTIVSAIVFATISSIIFGLVLFFTAGVISKEIFYQIELIAPLKIFATAVPFLTLIGLIASVFLGFDRVDVRAYFQDILRSVLFPLLLLVIMLWGLPFIGIFYAYVGSVIICFLSLIIYVKKKPLLSISSSIRSGISQVGKELIIFSLPLLIMSILLSVIVWTDTLMLGHFKNAEIVGLYNAAYPLTQFVSAPMVAINLLYYPITSRLYAQGKIGELQRNYSILTKWICLLIIPLSVVFILYPKIVLGTVFGAEYTPAYQALQILTTGFLIHSILGLNNTTLMALGKVKFVMVATIIAAGINVALNAVLIPPMGIVGAAIASLTALVVLNVIRNVKLYLLTKIQPFSKNVLKPFLASSALMAIIYIVFDNWVDINLWILIAIVISYYFMYFLAVIFTRSFDKEDVSLLLDIEKKLGVDLKPVKRILRKFL